MATESLDSYLGAMESDELASLNDLLAELEGHPGWQAFQKLLAVQVEKSTHQLLLRPLRDVQSYAHAAGHIQGVKQAQTAIIDKVRSKTRDVMAVLEAEREDGR